MTTYTAWDMIGFDGTVRTLPENIHKDPYTDPEAISNGPFDRAAWVRIKGGRTLYESVGNEGGSMVRLSRLDTAKGLRAVVRYVDPDTILEVVPDE